MSVNIQNSAAGESVCEVRIEMRNATNGSQAPDAPPSERRRRSPRPMADGPSEVAMMTAFDEVDMQPLQHFRQEREKAFREQYGVELGNLSFFVKAAVEAMRRVPRVNAENRGTENVDHASYGVGVTLSTEHGTVVPVLQDADRMSIVEVQRRLADLEERARQRRILPDELSGGAMTIADGGLHGALFSTPIVNHPEIAILGLHAIQDRPIARGGQVVIHPMMYLALSYDHRFIHDRDAMLFLQSVKELIESPVRLLVLA